MKTVLYMRVLLCQISALKQSFRIQASDISLEPFIPNHIEAYPPLVHRSAIFNDPKKSGGLFGTNLKGSLYL